ncbi:MAG: hypothetical protein ACLUZZ_05130 [Alistipes inops]
MRTGVGTYILIILVILILFGLVSIGDILSVAFYIVMGFIALVLIGILIFRYRMNRLRRQMEERRTFRTYTRGGAEPKEKGRRNHRTADRDIVEKGGKQRGRRLRGIRGHPRRDI